MCDIRIYLAALQKLAVGTDTGDFSFIQHNDLVRAHDSADPLRNDQDGRVAGFLLQRPSELRVGLEVEGGEAVIKNIDRAFFLPAPALC